MTSLLRTSTCGFAAVALLSVASLALADVERADADPTIAKKLEAKGTPFTIDSDGDYAITVNLQDQGRTQLVWVRSVVHETNRQSIREIWSYGMRSNEQRIPAHIANQMLSDNMEMIIGSWARINGDAVLVIKVDAYLSADELDEAIDIAASTADNMEKRLGLGDDL